MYVPVLIFTILINLKRFMSLFIYGFPFSLVLIVLQSRKIYKLISTMINNAIMYIQNL